MILDVIKNLDWGALLGMIIYLIWRDVIKPRKNKNKYSQPNYERRKINKNDKPGKAQVCIDHTRDMGQLETKVRMLCETNTREHGEIKEYIRERCDGLKADILDRLKRRIE